MEIYSKFLLVTIIQNIFVFNNVHSQGQPILLVIGYDGFRNDYLNRGITPTLSNFRDNGVHSEYLKTVYPPLAAPAFHSISTGLYPENHGTLEREFSMFTQNDVTPIWLLNQMNGGQSLCIMWPGGDENYDKTKEVSEKKCSIFVEYDAKVTLKNRADKIFENLETNPKINLVMFYVEQLDRITHFFGPLSRNSTLFVRRLDLLTKYIIKKLVEKRFYHRTNIFIVSDHGMISVNKEKQKIDPAPKYGIYEVLSGIDDVNARVETIVYFLYGRPVSMEKELGPYITYVTNFMDEARKNNKYEVVRLTPLGYNLSIATRKGKIEYAACPGYLLDLKSAHVNTYKGYYKGLENSLKTSDFVGVHGYLRQNDALFMAKGPLLARFKKIEPFEMVDLYSAFTRILNIHGDYERDGNYSRILPIFPEHEPIQWASILVTIFALALFFTIVFYFLMQHFIALV